MSIVFALIAAWVGAAFAALNDVSGWFGAGLGAALGCATCRWTPGFYSVVRGWVRGSSDSPS